MNVSRKFLLGCSVIFFAFPVFQANAQEYDYGTGQTQNSSQNTGTVQNSGYPASSQSYDQQYAGSVEKKHFYSGDWSLTLGGSVFSAPKYVGSDSYGVNFSPIFSLSRPGAGPKFVSRNDNPSFAFYENEYLRLGATGKILWKRDRDTSGDLKGLKDVKWGVEAGGFAEFYPLDGIRLRTDLRHGIGTHDAFALDLAMDFYHDITPTVRISAGPRAFYAGKDYFKTYYGVNAEESVRSGLSEYKAKSGWGSVGAGGAINWKTTDKVTTSVFTEYNRLQGPAADSSLVKERGSKNQLTVGVSASYRFDFNLD